jgi:hypothetical protein
MVRLAPIKSSYLPAKIYESINESNCEVKVFDIKEGLAYFSLAAIIKPLSAMRPMLYLHEVDKGKEILTWPTGSQN